MDCNEILRICLQSINPTNCGDILIFQVVILREISQQLLDRFKWKWVLKVEHVQYLGYSQKTVKMNIGISLSCLKLTDRSMLKMLH